MLNSLVGDCRHMRHDNRPFDFDRSVRYVWPADDTQLVRTNRMQCSDVFYTELVKRLQGGVLRG